MVLLFTIAGYGQFDEGGGTFPSNFGPISPGYVNPFTFTGINELTGVTITTPSSQSSTAAANAAQQAASAANAANAAAQAAAAAAAANAANAAGIAAQQAAAQQAAASAQQAATAAQQANAPQTTGGNTPQPPLKDWYLDNDADGWHSQTAKSSTSPGPKWTTTSKGLDCNDNIYSADNNCANDDCEITADDVYNTFGGKRSIIDPMINTINKYAKLLGINSKIELQHFLAQAALESKNFTSTEEGTKYQTKSVMSTFGKFFNDIGDENKNPQLKNLSDFGVTKSSNGKSYTQNREALFNYIYSDQNRIRVGYSPIGNTQSGDGYKFIGRGIIQITGRDNYTKFNNWYKSNVDPNADLVNNPKLLDTNKEIGTLASLWYFKERVMDRLGGITNNTTVNQVTKKVNTKMLEKKKRADNFKSAKEKINCKN